MSVFRFKYFDVKQEKNPLKVGTDSMLLGAFIDASGKQNALDLGAGTGVLSLMVAQKNPNVKIDAIEWNEQGATECAFNFENSNWSKNLTSIHGNYFEYRFDKSYDLIFSNPPYHLDSLNSKESEVSTAKHCNEGALKHFFELINSLLTADGVFWMIIPYINHLQFFALAAQNELFPIEITTIHSKPSKKYVRLIVCFSYKQNQPIETEFTIRDESGNYSDAYKIRTKEYHWTKFE